MASRSVRAPAMLQSYVLHRYDWSETSLILDLFTREDGRLAVAAKGAKRPHSQLRAVLLPFQAPASAGRHRAQRTSRPNVPTGRARGDCPVRNRSRSAASSPASA